MLSVQGCHASQSMPTSNGHLFRVAKKLISVFSLLLLTVLYPLSAASSEDAAQDLLGTMTGETAKLGVAGLDQPRLRQQVDGYPAYTSATPGTYFAHEIADDEFSPGEFALDFVDEHEVFFGTDNPNVSLDVMRTTSNRDLTYVRLQQSYSDIPVLGGEMIVHVYQDIGVTAMLSDITRNTDPFESGEISLRPTLSATQAEELAILDLASKSELSEDAFTVTEAPELVIYDPIVVHGEEDEPAVTWVVSVEALQHPVGKRMYVDAHTGALAYWESLICKALYRLIYDAENDPEQGFGQVRRWEGEPPSGIAEVDTLYNLVGETYDFYESMHARDSYDDSGASIHATARYGKHCPNAYYHSTTNQLVFCEGFAVRDVVGHEYTHAVTAHSSQLSPGPSESGAINESFSDIWGEAIDLWFGVTPPQEKWLIGEETPVGVIRNMADPNAEGHPAYYEQSGYWHFGQWWDFRSYQHTNAGVGNKLWHLLAGGDGDFRGNNHTPLDSDLETSIAASVKLYYEVQTNRLTSAAEYVNFGDALIDSVVDAVLGNIDLGSDINWDAGAIQIVINGVLAVEIDQ